MSLTATVTSASEKAPAPSGPHEDRAFTNPSQRRSASAIDVPPLQRRILANRENARKSTGPKTAAGKAGSRCNAIKHGLASRVALPRETVVEIAEHFWQLVQAYRPEDAVTVNAILEMTICSWKFRRLFEQYAGNQARTRLTVNDDRKARENRLAQSWFRKLSADPRKALGHLYRSTSGLDLIVENCDNLIAELNQPEGSLTSRQFMMAIHLGGFDDFEIWDNVQLRTLWSAWFACRPGRKAAPEDFNSVQDAFPEYRTRARKAIETAPLAAEGRRQLIEWVRNMRDEAVKLHETQEQVEEELAALQPMAAGWPAPEETSQHLLYLRYSNQVDRKTRELQALIAARPSVSSADAWKFDDELLPSDWKAVLIQHRTMRSVVAGIAKGDLSEDAAETQLSDNLFGLDERVSRPGPEHPCPAEAQVDADKANRPEPVDPLTHQPTPPPAESIPDSLSKSAESVDLRNTMSPFESNEPAHTAGSQVPAPASSDSPRSPGVETGIEPQAVIPPRPGADPGLRSRSPAPPRSSRRRLRPDKPADVRKDRHRHTGSKPVRPPEARSL